MLAGEAVAGLAAELADRLDPAFLAEAGWDPVSRVLSLPAEHPLLGRTVCRVGGCTSTAHGGPTGGVCWRCFTRLGAQGLTGPQIASLPELPPLPDRPAGCAVPGVSGCRRRRGPCCAPRIPAGSARRPGMSLEEFLTDPRVRPLPALGPCQVAACTRRSECEHGYCPTHYVRWRTAVTTDPEHRPPALAAHRVRGLRGRPGEPARAAAAGGDRGAVRGPAARPAAGRRSPT